MKNIPYQQNAINELTDKTIRLLNLGGKRHKIVFEAPTGAGKNGHDLSGFGKYNRRIERTW